MKTLTVITTTYNRAYCLPRVYNSLLEQDCKDFVWLIVDDGSTDDTKELVQEWIAQDKIEIRYHYKENGGMHTARNAAYVLADTPLNTIIDSDDWMAPGAVGKIVDFWENNKSDDVAGMITLNAAPDGQLIGTPLPDGVKRCSYRDFWNKYKMSGDKKLVFRSELTKLYPYPEYPGEKFYPASYKFNLIDRDYDFLLFDCVTCIVDNNENSMTRDKYAQYKSCPRGFMHYRKHLIEQHFGFKKTVMSMLHYEMERRIAKEKPDREIKKMPLYWLCYLPGGLLKYYITHTKRKY